jgi:hypothetical protein
MAWRCRFRLVVVSRRRQGEASYLNSLVARAESLEGARKAVGRLLADRRQQDEGAVKVETHRTTRETTPPKRGRFTVDNAGMASTENLSGDIKKLDDQRVHRNLTGESLIAEPHHNCEDVRDGACDPNDRDSPGHVEGCTTVAPTVKDQRYEHTDKAEG